MTGLVSIGIDAGASKTEVLVTSDSDQFTFLLPEGINYQRLGMDETIRCLGEVFGEILSRLDESSQISACIGLAGADDQQDRRLIAKGLQVRLGRTKRVGASFNVQVVQDSVVALEAAYPGGSGAVVVIGTGSIVVARTVDGQIVRTGGWGYLLGDEGSGYRIGLLALRKLSKSMDNNAIDEFDKALLNHLGATKRSDLIHRVYRVSGVVQTVAPVVIEWAERGDGSASQILANEASGVADCFRRMLSNVETPIEQRYTLTGGLSESDFYRRLVVKAISEVAEVWEMVAPEYPKPVYGALSLARSM